MTEQQRIDAERLAEVQEMTLAIGKHKEEKHAFCVMEAVAYVAGEKWSDKPSCASPVIGAFLRSWNDSLSDEPRNRLLKPLIPLLVDTKASDEIEERRSYMALDWMIRVFTPKWLDMVHSLRVHATALRDLECIDEMGGAAAAGLRVTDAGIDARIAVWLVAGVVAEDTAIAAAKDAAKAAVNAAAGGAAKAAAGTAADATQAWVVSGTVAGTVARVAAQRAARVASKDAAGAALKPTTEWLQASALDLVHRMIRAA